MGCHGDCKTCDGDANNNCLSCKATGKTEHDSTKKTCSKPQSSNSCDSSKANCATWGDGTANSNCLTCNAGYYLTPEVTSGTPAKAHCNKQCHGDCKTCDGDANNNCLSCKATGKTEHDSTKKTCSEPTKKCGAKTGCATCNTANDACATCPTGKEVKEGECVDKPTDDNAAIISTIAVCAAVFLF